MFRTTLRDNVRVARPDADDAAIRRACEQANAWEFIERLPGGLSSPVGEGGSTLSGGQRQRLAIARALLADPPFFILDEATSALDTLSERLIQEALDRNLRGRTSIMIAHRLATVRTCDRIIVLAEGRVRQDGTYDELVAREGMFRDLVAGQQLPCPSAGPCGRWTRHGAARGTRGRSDRCAPGIPAPTPPSPRTSLLPRRGRPISRARRHARAGCARTPRRRRRGRPGRWRAARSARSGRRTSPRSPSRHRSRSRRGHDGRPRAGAWPNSARLPDGVEVCAAEFELRGEPPRQVALPRSGVADDEDVGGGSSQCRWSRHGGPVRWSTRGPRLTPPRRPRRSPRPWSCACRRRRGSP
jgi:hypothetical protein